MEKVHAVKGYGFDSNLEIQEVDLPFVFRDAEAASIYAVKLKKVADKLSGYYRNMIRRDHEGVFELSNEEYEIFQRRAEYWGIRKNRVWVEELEVR